MSDTIVLAYSGGLDTSAAVKWLQEERDYEVVCLLADLGNVGDLEGAERRAAEAGAKEFAVVDAREDFLRYFAFPALAANAVYEGAYPLATALGRPLIAKLLVDKAREAGAAAVGPRLHRQGQRPGPLRRRAARAGPRPRDRRHGARERVDPR